MANMKQKGSNIGAAEWFTARCPVRCEFCFTNFGDTGQGIPYAMYCDTPAGMSSFDYATGATTEARLAKDKMPPELLRAVVGERKRSDPKWSPRNWEKLPGKRYRKGKYNAAQGRKTPHYREDHESFYCIPKVPELGWRIRTEKFKCANGKMLPATIRCNTKSDSSLAPIEWIELLKATWGDACFFNTSVRAIKLYPQHMQSGVFHKLVVTANPGKCRIPDYGPTNGETKKASIRRLEGQLQGEKGDPGSFYKPLTLTDLGFADQENKVKFYRVRTLPTIGPKLEPRWKDDSSIVWTVLRFKGIQQACEFARKYNCELECYTDAKSQRMVVEHYGFKVAPSAELVSGENLLRMRSTDRLNGSKLKGEWTVLYAGRAGWWKTSRDQMKHLRYVCDRAMIDCKGCGLCHTLDVSIGKRPKREYAKQKTYVEAKVEANPPALPSSWFEAIFEDLQRHANPGQFAPDRLAAALQEIAAYVLQGENGPDDYHMDSWNEHEHADSVLQYACWLLLREAKRQGLDRKDAWEMARRFSGEACGLDLFAYNPDFIQIYDNLHEANAIFGPT